MTNYFSLIIEKPRRPYASFRLIFETDISFYQITITVIQLYYMIYKKKVLVSFIELSKVTMIQIITKKICDGLSIHRNT